MIGSKLQNWNPSFLGLIYGVDFTIDQEYRLDTKSLMISTGSNNSIITSNYNYALNFPSGTTQNFLLGGAPSNVTQNPFTIYLKFDMLSSLKTFHLFGNGNGTSADQHFLKYDNSANELQYRIYENVSGVPETASCSWTPSLNTAYLILVDYDGTDLRIFIDGASQSISYTNKANFNSLMAASVISTGLGFGFVNGAASLAKLEGRVYGCGSKGSVLADQEKGFLENYYSRYS